MEEGDWPLFNTLRDWRNGLAREEGVPAYVACTKSFSRVADSGQSLVITQNGEAKAVLQDIGRYEETQESLLLLKTLALSAAHEQAGLTKPVSRAFKDLLAVEDEPSVRASRRSSFS